MQPLAQNGLSDAQVTAMLVAPDLQIRFGVELLNTALALVEDISGDVAKDGAKVSHNNLADIHSTCALTVSRPLAWGADRLRPYVVMSSPTAGVSNVRFNRGVFIPTSPERKVGETPESSAIVGYDGLYQLMDNIGNSHYVAAGANVLDAVRATLAEAGVLAPVLLDTAGAAKVLATDRVWPLTSSESPSWLRVTNDLLAAIGYRGVWCDWNGAFRSSPYVLPTDRPSEFRLDVGSLETGIVAQERLVANDVFGLPNWMRVVRNDMVAEPTELNGWHTMTNPDKGPSSIAVVKLRKAPVVFLDATSQADLVTQGERLFAAATRSSELLTMKMSMIPLWHVDRLEYNDPELGYSRQIQVRSWEMPLNGDDVDVVAETVT